MKKIKPYEEIIISSYRFTRNFFTKKFFCKNEYIFWPTIAILFLLYSIVTLNNNNIEFHWCAQIVFVFGVWLWPMVYIHISKKYYQIYDKNIRILFSFEPEEQDCRKWYEKYASNAFSWRSTYNLTINLIIWIAGIITLSFLKLDNNFYVIKNQLCFGVIITMFVGMSSVPILIFLVFALRSISNKTVKLDYFTKGYYHIDAIKRFYLGLSLYTVFINISLFVGISDKVFEVNYILIGWIACISILTTFTFSAVIYYTRKIEGKSKYLYIKDVNNKLNNIINVNNNCDELESLLKHRDYLIHYKKSKVDIVSLFTILAPIISSLIIAIISTGIIF